MLGHFFSDFLFDFLFIIALTFDYVACFHIISLKCIHILLWRWFPLGCLQFYDFFTFFILTSTDSDKKLWGIKFVWESYFRILNNLTYYNRYFIFYFYGTFLFLEAPLTYYNRYFIIYLYGTFLFLEAPWSFVFSVKVTIKAIARGIIISMKQVNIWS